MLLRYIDVNSDKFNCEFKFDCDLTFFVLGRLYPDNNGIIANDFVFEFRGFLHSYLDCLEKIHDYKSEQIDESHERHVCDMLCYKLNILITNGKIEEIDLVNEEGVKRGRLDYLKIIYFFMARGSCEVSDIHFDEDFEDLVYE